MIEPNDGRPLPDRRADIGEPAMMPPEVAEPEGTALPAVFRARLRLLLAAAVALLARVRQAAVAGIAGMGGRIAEMKAALVRWLPARRGGDDAIPRATFVGPSPPFAPRSGGVPGPQVDEHPLFGVPPGYPIHPQPELLLRSRHRRWFRIVWSDPSSGEFWLGRVTAPLWAASEWLETRLKSLRWPEDRRSRTVVISAGLLLGASAVALAAAPGSRNTATVVLDAEADPKKVALEQAIHDYILAHPEIIPEAMERLHARETAKTVAENREAIETPFAGAWAGAKDGDVTLVEFSDYSCGFCRASVADVDKLLAGDKRLKVVWREIPILGEKSEKAARLALSAARQGRFLDFHRLMYASGVPDTLSMEKVQKAVGMDPDKTAKDIADPAIQTEIDHNIDLARTLGISGTPTFIIGDRMLSGAVGYAALKQAVEDARAKAS